MVKHKSVYISDKDLRVETDRYWDENYERVEVVKLTMISTNLEVAFCSYRGQLDAYNKALKKLENKYCELYQKRSYQTPCFNVLGDIGLKQKI